LFVGGHPIASRSQRRHRRWQQAGADPQTQRRPLALMRQVQIAAGAGAFSGDPQHPVAPGGSGCWLPWGLALFLYFAGVKRSAAWPRLLAAIALNG